jgi:RNA polymerase sigma factor (sigma-70 family)
MNAIRAVPILRLLRRLAAGRATSLTDSDLLQRYLDQGDEAAFAALVERHGPMVLGVCWSVLRHRQDAEDAFQATFLVLAHKAGSIRRREGLGSWLHGVARRVALKARAGVIRRQALEAKATPLAVDPTPDDVTWGELREALHAELAALPEHLREPLVLCYLEGLTQDEAARRLGCTAATLKGRLQRGRERLRVRLERRGLSLAAAMTAALSGQTLAAPVSAVLAETTAQAAVQFSIRAATTSTAALLAGSVMQQMASVKLKVLAAVLLVVGVVAAGGVGMQTQQPADKEPVAEKLPQQRPGPRTDLYGDVLPEGAVARLGTLRFNHGDGLSNLLFTPDGKTIISFGGEMLRFWDAASGKELGQYPWAKACGYYDLALSSDGKTLVFLDQIPGDILRVWDLAQRKEVRSVQLPVKRGSLVTFFYRNALSPDGKLAVAHTQANVHLFDVETAKELCKLPRKGDEIRAAIFAGNDRVVTADKKQTIEVWEARTAKLVRQFAHGAPVEVLRASADGRRLAALEHDWIDGYQLGEKDAIHVWDLATGTKKHRLEAAANRKFLNLQFAPDGKSLLTWKIGPDGRELSVWDTETGERLIELDGVNAKVMAVSPDGSRLAQGSGLGQFGLYDLKTGRRLSIEDSQLDVIVSLTPRGDRALAMGYSSISTWDATTGRRLHSIGLPSRVYRDPDSVHHSPDGRYASIFTQDGEESHILIWDLATGKRLHTLRSSDKPVPGVSRFSPDSSLLATCQQSKEAVTRLWDVRTGKEVRSFKDTKARWPRHLDFTADGKTLLVAGRGTGGYDVASGKELFSWQMEPLPSKSSTRVVAVDKDGKEIEYEPFPWRALTVSPEGTVAACVLSTEGFYEPVADRIALCDARTGRIIRRWSDSGKPSMNRLEKLAFSPDGRLLASSDGTVVHLWEVETGKELRTFQGHRGEVSSLSFSANGRRLASASNDSTVVIWDLVPAPPGGALPAKNPGEETIDAWWADLSSDDARKAYAAVWRLIESPEATVPFLRRHLRPVPEPDAKKIRQHLTDLDSERFAVRERASKELEDLGPAAVPALREVLDKNPTLEMRRRVEQILSRSLGRATPPDTLRRLRALQVLEQIGSPDARRWLTEMAKGAAYAEETQDAQAALRRLSRGSEP